jgi:hypothetical protein
MTSWDITPRDAHYTGPKITLTDNGARPCVARADDPAAGPWVLLPASLLQYIDQDSIRRNGDREAAEAFNYAVDVVFAGAPPGGCGGHIEMRTT